MAFSGLFVGIDRYASPNVSWLSCARRDAEALHALFSDTMGGHADLLTDEQATHAAIENAFDRLASSSQDDFVVIAFSGHGSETHELLTYDADPNDLPASCIPLDKLTEWFSRIPSRRVLCVLDCCFSGGMGAKVLSVPVRPRSLASTAVLLDQLSGDGRLIFTASAANEEAWENQRLGHGLLTRYLIEALQGADEVRQGGKVSIYRLLDYVTQNVIAASAQLGKSQNPTMRGRIDGILELPVFVPGPRYRAAFPERVQERATADVASLAGFGFPPALLEAWAGAIPSLNQLQLDAVNDFGVLAGEHLVVSAPTSSGKTMIGELAALRGVLERKRAFFLLPLKALVNDKYQQFGRTYRAFGLRTIRATGEVADDIPALMRGHYDVCLLTYEKFAMLALGSPHILEQVGTIIVDEVQMIADRSRGVNLEFVLTLLRMRRRHGAEPQLIALSAVIGDTNGLERWLGARLLRRTERPVPLEEGILRADGSVRYLDPDGQERTAPRYIQRDYRKNSGQDWIIPLLRRLVGENKQVIVFRETKGEARGCALYLARELGLPPAQAALEALPSGDPSQASEALRTALRGGVAFHVSDLDRDERLVVEEHFRAPNSSLRVIAATTTLAMGVNTPASAVVIEGLEHPGDAGPQPYTVAEYKNIVGRAGRLGHSERGQSFLLALTPQSEYGAWAGYLRGAPEDVQSRFLAKDTDPRSLILRVLTTAQRSAGGQGMSAEEVVEFLEGSFGAFQERHARVGWQWDRDRLLAALNDLQRHRMVEIDEKGGYRLTELGRLAGEGGVEVETVTRIVDALGPLSKDTINEPALIAATQLTAELDNVLFPLNRKSTQKEPQTWAEELRLQGVPGRILHALQRSATDRHQPTLRAKKAVACLLWITDRPLAEIERTLTQFGGAFDGAAGPIRSVAARTCDLLPAVARIAEVLHPGLDLSARRARLLARLEVGASAAAADLASQTGSRLARGDYQRLAAAGLAKVDAIAGASDDRLLVCLGGSRPKLAEVRRAVQAHQRQAALAAVVPPVLPQFEA